jgi:putative DNA methylase
MAIPVRKKLIEVSIPLEAINVASAREKSIRHGHPSTLHLWWARRPLAACRAVLFAQLVDDPSSWPNRFPTEEAQDTERRRLHKVIEAMVPWEASNNEAILNAARWEIARSVAWGLGEEPPAQGDGPAILDYLQTKAPPVYDPFSGGGSIPLEAQRLGLRAYGSDLNPVAVLIGKALVEIPPKFAGRPPVNSNAQSELERGGRWNDTAARGLAEDVRCYGQWVRDQAEVRIGHLYPQAQLPDGSKATVIAWIWARTVTCPNPACRAEMPLSGSFMLSTKAGQKTWVVAHFEKADGRPRPIFTVESGALTKDREKELAIGSGYMAATGKKAKAVFRCICCGEGPVKGEYVDAEANAGRMSSVPVAIVAEGQRGRTYLPVDTSQRDASDLAATKLEQEIDPSKIPNEECRGTFASNAQGRRYGFSVFSDYFSPRQIVALTTFSDLVAEVHAKIIQEGLKAGLSANSEPLHAGGLGAVAYADAVITYLAFAVDRLADRSSTLCTWDTGAEGKSSTGAPGRSAAIRGTFSRQAISMTWDFAEANVFSSSAANFNDAVGWVLKPFDHNRIPAIGLGHIGNLDAAQNNYPVRPIVISTDPPYYDNIGYADLSDFFYVWLRRCLYRTWPDLFRRLTTPKTEELIATPYRRRDPAGLSRADSDALSDKDRAEAFFMEGMKQALSKMSHLRYTMRSSSQRSLRAALFRPAGRRFYRRL